MALIKSVLATDPAAIAKIKAPTDGAGALVAAHIDARTARDLVGGHGGRLLQPEARILGVEACVIEAAIHGQRLAEPARPSREIAVGVLRPTQAAHRRLPLHRSEGAHENRGGESLPLGDDVQAMVHAVDEIDVEMTGWAVHRGGAFRLAAVGVTGLVLLTDVGLHLGDVAGEALALKATYHALAQQIAGQCKRIAGVKFGG